MKLIDIVGATPFGVGYRIAFLTNFLREPILRWMERELGIIRPELTVLMCLKFRDGLNARDIGEITEQPSNTISRAVGSLLAKGMISRRDDHEDGRRKLLFLEPEGERLHDQVIDKFVEAEDHLTACLTESERAQLLTLLDRMARDVPRWQKLSPYKDKSRND